MSEPQTAMGRPEFTPNCQPTRHPEPRGACQSRATKHVVACRETPAGPVRLASTTRAEIGAPPYSSAPNCFSPVFGHCHVPDPCHNEMRTGEIDQNRSTPSSTLIWHDAETYLLRAHFWTLPKLNTGVRFPSSAPTKSPVVGCRSTSRPRSGRVGRPLPTIVRSWRAGHASSRAASIYQHTTRDRDAEIADRLSGPIRRSPAVQDAALRGLSPSCSDTVRYVFRARWLATAQRRP